MCWLNPWLFIIRHRFRLSTRRAPRRVRPSSRLPLDMINLSHAKKAQALASDLEYRTKLHDYTVMPDDIKVQQAKKAYSLQSEVRVRRKGWAPTSVLYITRLMTLLSFALQNQYRSDLNWMKGVGWDSEGCMNITHVKKAGEQLSDVSITRMNLLM